MSTKISVNSHTIRSNRKHGINNPPIRVQHRGEVTYCHRVWIDGPSTLVHAPDDPLPCGAAVYVVTDAPVLVDFEADRCR